MSDFLMRLVTATYQPAATMHPRPVAHYEPTGAVLPFWSEGEETPSTPPITAPPGQAPVAPVSAPTKMQAPPPPAPYAPAPPPSMAPMPPLQKVSASKAAAPLAAQTLKPLQPAPLPPITTAKAPAPPLQPGAQPLSHAPLMAPPHTLPAPPRPPHSEDMRNRQDEPRVTPTLAQGVVTPLLIQVVAEPGSTQPAPLPQRSAPPPAAAPIAASHKPLAGVQTAAPLPVALPTAKSEAHHAAPMRTRPADALAARPQPQVNAPSLAAAASVTPPATTAPPVIRVTIGRIVIKAEGGKPSKPAKPHPAPAKPGLSLDAYLKRRGGGDA